MGKAIVHSFFLGMEQAIIDCFLEEKAIVACFENGESHHIIFLEWKGNRRLLWEYKTIVDIFTNGKSNRIVLGMKKKSLIAFGNGKNNARLNSESNGPLFLLGMEKTIVDCF